MHKTWWGFFFVWIKYFVGEFEESLPFRFLGRKIFSMGFKLRIRSPYLKWVFQNVWINLVSLSMSFVSSPPQSKKLCTDFYQLCYGNIDKLIHFFFYFPMTYYNIGIWYICNIYVYNCSVYVDTIYLIYV